MRNGRLLPVLLGAACLFGCGPARPTLYQTGTIDGLLAGAYDGDATVADVLRHGDFGLGTFQALDGEMVVLDGRAYQVLVDGTVRRPPGRVRTPFAAVTRFRPQMRVELPGGPPAALHRQIEDRLGQPQCPTAVRIDGTFAYVKVRSVPAQVPPYPPLVRAVEGQRVYDLHNVRGTIVAFRCPESLGGLNVGGWHMHFLTDDRSAGGHVLDCLAGAVVASWTALPRIEADIPRTPAYRKASTQADRQGQLQAVE